MHTMRNSKLTGTLVNSTSGLLSTKNRQCRSLIRMRAKAQSNITKSKTSNFHMSLKFYSSPLLYQYLLRLVSIFTMFFMLQNVNRWCEKCLFEIQPKGTQSKWCENTCGCKPTLRRHNQPKIIPNLP